MYVNYFKAIQLKNIRMQTSNILEKRMEWESTGEKGKQTLKKHSK